MCKKSIFFRLDVYFKDSRNLKRVDDIHRRSRLLQKGKIDIVSFLTKLPKTLHDPRSLVVDVPVASVSKLKCCLNKVFIIIFPFYHYRAIL